jgi:aspartate/tyrosine/aromatic aminotransferase
MSLFISLQLQPDDPILGIPKQFAADPRLQKVNLGIGSYLDAEGHPYILDCVRDAEEAILKKKLSKEYLPIAGDEQLLSLTGSLIYGQHFAAAAQSIFFSQTIGSTGALFLGGQFLAKHLSQNIYLPNSSWPNHKAIFNNAGLNIDQYFYYDDRTHQIDFDRMIYDIEKMPTKSIILLQASCHNPTGIDPTNDQWMEISSVLKKNQVIPFFDFAYQGFKKSPDDDAFPIRYFLSQGHEFLTATSFAKNFGLYGERVGTLSIVSKDEISAKKAGSYIKQLIRGNYSNPPRHGAEIITEILSSEKPKKMWCIELSNMCDRLKEMRHTLATGLQAKATHFDWTFLNKQVGFFSYCGLNETQVHSLIKNYGIYMPSNGRINIAGLNGHNMNYVIDALIEVTHT